MMIYVRRRQEDIHDNSLSYVVGVQIRMSIYETCREYTDFFDNPMMKMPCLVSVVDDDESVRESLPDLLKELGFTAQTFSSAEEFLGSYEASQTRCLILDIAMPGMSGPELQQQLKQRRIEIPIIFITAHQDPAIRSRVLEDGTVQCLLKPFSDTTLLQALNTALKRR